MGQFSAHSKYDFWVGSMAADDADGPCGFAQNIRTRLHLDSNDIILGLSFLMQESAGGQLGNLKVEAIVYRREGLVQEIVAELGNLRGPIPVRKFLVRATLEEVFAWFKTATFVITAQSFELQGRSYSTTPD